MDAERNISVITTSDATSCTSNALQWRSHELVAMVQSRIDNEQLDIMTEGRQVECELFTIGRLQRVCDAIHQLVNGVNQLRLAIQWLRTNQLLRNGSEVLYKPH
jgi:hypothetical protein